MSETTQILFNSPALHSLKREQLVKLCKIHAIKANGKNVELIEKLKHHALSLPRDSPLSIAARSEQLGDMTSDDSDAVSVEAHFPPRPSEQWEVMDSIMEVDDEGSSGGTIRSREFGVGGSRNSKSTVTSSIRAIANSFGIKRSTSSKADSNMTSLSSLSPADELTQHSVPYSSLPEPSPADAPLTDHFTFTPTVTTLKKFDFFDTDQESTPLPGHILRPGMPAPENARLSLGLGAPSTPHRNAGPSTTMRLVSNSSMTSVQDAASGDYDYSSTPKLKPFHTSFDLVLASPSTGIQTWPPPSKDASDALYPTLPTTNFSAFPPPTPPPAATSPAATPSTGATGPTSSDNDTSKLVPPSPSRFVFGSPDHHVSNAQFRSAAASVLEEMNKRLEADGVQGIGSTIIEGIRPGANDGRPIKPLRKSAVGAGPSMVKEKFNKMHMEQFGKMEGIGEYLARKEASRSGSISSLKQLVTKPSQEPVHVGGKRKSSVLVDGGDRRGPSGTKRVSATRVISNGRRKGAIPGGFGDEDEEEEEERVGKKAKVDFSAPEIEKKIDVDEKTQKEREAIRRKLEMNRQRRRSSGRVSMGARASMGRGGLQKKPETKPSRFGFFSTAKSLVKGVWGKSKPAPAPTPVIKALAPSKMSAPNKPSTGSANINAGSTALSTPSTSGSLKPPSMASRMHSKGSVSSTNTTRSRSPIPSFGSHTRMSSTGSGSSVRTSSVMSKTSTRNAIRESTSSRTSSMGTRGSLSGHPPVRRTPSSTTSRLLAPTASSLAKAHAPVGGSVGRISRASSVQTAIPARTSTLFLQPPNQSNTKPFNAITNSSSSIQPKSLLPPKSPSVFSRPLVVPSASGIPSPVKSNSNGVVHQRSISGRRPRISRSKVIAKLASQRDKGAGASSSGLHGTGKVRSSLGAKEHRKSFAGGARRSHAGGDMGLMLSAKKRARQSEYARRQSLKPAGTPMAPPKFRDVSAMDVDA